ncbi:MAG TPA: ATP-binding protein [Trebonia sp.]|nr:ATP-binding protein [Trebonia sp.]
MDRPAGDRQQRSEARTRAATLGSVTVPGEPEQVSRVRGFVTKTLQSTALPSIDSDAATLLTSELVTNAILHTDSGRPGGAITVVVLRLPDGILIEVVDDGSAGTPVVKSDALAGEGQGLYLVQQLASQWGYLRDSDGTTVWFHITNDDRAASRADPDSPAGRVISARPPDTWPPDSWSQEDHRHREQLYGAARHDGQQQAASNTPAQIRARSASLVT